MNYSDKLIYNKIVASRLKKSLFYGNINNKKEIK